MIQKFPQFLQLSAEFGHFEATVPFDSYVSQIFLLRVMLIS
jgi:hypothetical protein